MRATGWQAFQRTCGNSGLFAAIRYRSSRPARPVVSIRYRQIALTGATGFVGQMVLDVAAMQGIAVRALTRRPQAPRPGVEWVNGDLSDPVALARLMDGAEAVIHVAGVVNTPDPAVFESGNVAGTLAVIEAAKAAGIARLVHVSSLSAREPGLSLYGASKARAEKLVSASGLDWTMVRPPAVYGPRDGDMVDLFRAAAKWGVVPVPAQGRTSMIHAEDLARLLIALLPGSEAVSFHTFEPDDGKPYAWSHVDMARAIGAAVGKRVRILRLTEAWMARAAKLDMKFRKDNAKLTLDRVGYMMHPDWVVSKAARVPAEVWEPRISTRAGLKATADWYRAEGWL
ncbi:MAG: NAD(P)-dependent oxidoreductase [Sphingomonadales bacterium]|nr:NAD(P)-dependent oxidoreductase [Sphingomonadales bacterium]